MKTFAGILNENRNIGPGFDFLRVFLALSIVTFHSWTVTNQYFAPFNWDATPAWIIHYTLVPMFFALSGFLVSGSAGRLSLKNFLINRGMRIVPALAVDTFVCALIIGPVFTTVPLHQYFISREFAVFFCNIFGWVHFTLPGVFTTHAVAEVNGSLWTVPFELACYALMSGLILLRWVKNLAAVSIFVFSYLVLAVVIWETGLVGHLPWHGVGKAISVAFIEHEAQAVTAFIFGVMAYQLRARIPYSIWLFAACVALVLGIAFAFPSMDAGEIPPLRLLLMPAIVYITIFIGLTRMPLPKFFKTGDYSYGIYLYHQPFLQIIITLFPVAALAPHTGPWCTLFAGLPLILGVAWLSWHLIEKPLLALRKRFSLMAKERGMTDAPAAAPHLHAPEMSLKPSWDSKTGG
jgi:peptidoglycan/LPS O-acetylase OafA/YrhL